MKTSKFLMLAIITPISNMVDHGCIRVYVIVEYHSQNVKVIAWCVCVQIGVFVDSMFGNTTMFLLVALAWERYVAVVHPLAVQKRRLSPFTWSMFCVMLCWALATILAVPDIFTHRMEDLVFTEDRAGIFVLPKQKLGV